MFKGSVAKFSECRIKFSDLALANFNTELDTAGMAQEQQASASGGYSLTVTGRGKLVAEDDNNAPNPNSDLLDKPFAGRLPEGYGARRRRGPAGK